MHLFFRICLEWVLPQIQAISSGFLPYQRSISLVWTAIMPAMSAVSALAALLASAIASPLAVEPPEEVFPPAGYLEKSMVATLAIAKQMEDKTPTIGFADGSSLFSAHLSPGAEISMTHAAAKGEVYMVAAAPDDPKLDINLWITDADEKELGKDTSSSAACMAPFKTADDDGFEFKLRNDSEEDAFVTLVLLKHGGHSRRTSQAAESIDTLMTAVRAMSAVDDEMSFADGGEWCLYGGFLKEKTSFTAAGLDLSAPVTLFIGACSEGSKDIDILLSDKEGQAVASDEENDNRPVVEVKKKIKGVQALLGNSGGDAFCTMIALKASK